MLDLACRCRRVVWTRPRIRQGRIHTARVFPHLALAREGAEVVEGREILVDLVVHPLAAEVVGVHLGARIAVLDLEEHDGEWQEAEWAGPVRRPEQPHLLRLVAVPKPAAV